MPFIRVPNGRSGDGGRGSSLYALCLLLVPPAPALRDLAAIPVGPAQGMVDLARPGRRRGEGTADSTVRRGRPVRTALAPGEMMPEAIGLRRVLPARVIAGVPAKAAGHRQNRQTARRPGPAA